MSNPKNKTKIALVKPAFESLLMWNSWCDGLYGAMNELGKDFNVKVFGYCETPAYIERGNLSIQLSDNISSLKYWLNSFNPKFIFGWGTSVYPWEELDCYSDNRPNKKILLFAGGIPDNTNAKRHFDHVVVENPSDQKFFPGSTVAFGTNTDVFKPMDLNKQYPSFFPAAFALWKRHDLWAEAMPQGSLALGQMQDHETECYKVCNEKGHLILPSLPMDTMPYFYNQSKGVCLTSDHMGGCQRAALEAMACNIPVLATTDSKASEFEGVWTCEPDVESIRSAYLLMILNFENGDYDLRGQFIEGKLDHITYAQRLKELL